MAPPRPTSVLVSAPLNRLMMTTASYALGRLASSPEAHRLLRQELEQVVQRWRVLGEWVARVDSGQWYQDWRRAKRL